VSITKDDNAKSPQASFKLEVCPDVTAVQLLDEANRKADTLLIDLKEIKCKLGIHDQPGK
jgi:hypothetical protein